VSSIQSVTFAERQTIARPNSFEIDLDAVVHNIRALRHRVGRDVLLFAALKANAYGFGVIPVARAALAAGADALAMVDVSDAINLRQLGIDVPILLYGGIPADRELVEALEAHDLMPTLLDLEDARTYSRHATGRLPVFLKFDVGLERMGMAPEDVPAIAAALSGLPKLKLHGAYTHLHVPPNADPLATDAYMRRQFRRFSTALEALKRCGHDPRITMAASSAVLMQTNDMNLNAVDPGHLLFGMYPAGPRATPLDLRAAFHALKSELIQVKTLSRPESLEMAPFPVRDGMRIGVLPLGIADGMSQLHCGQVLIRGRRVPVLGVSLEHTRVDLTEVEAGRGDEVVVIGRQGDEEIRPDEVLTHLGQHVPSALPLAVHQGVPRRYLGGVS